jgi:hypothetical protein
MVFMQPQRLIVPLFQRPYVWNQEQQWEPLWGDVARVAKRLLGSEMHHHPHFLGAVVLQQVHNKIGSLQERVIIDGQQRLTTLQLLLDALHAEFQTLGATQAASRLDSLIVNQEAFWERPEDRFKVWPTNRDRPAFNAVMRAEAPVDYSELAEPQARLVMAHKYFSESAREWLFENGPEEAFERAEALEQAVRELLQLVVIELGADENAQEIFETLNARGAQLTAADLIKNFVFQRLVEDGVEVESVYESQWKDFETAFWESEISVGRVRHARSAVFLNQWLIAKTGEEVVAREVFSRFKTFADFDAGMSMFEMVTQVHHAATLYRGLVERAASLVGPIDRAELFVYRTSALESEIVKPFVLFLLDPDAEAIPVRQLEKALSVVESWIVRRMLVRATTKAYNQLVSELIVQLRKGERSQAGDIVEGYLSSQTGDARYWPDDDELRREIPSLLAYRRMRGGRVRMVLEAIEDYRRGWVGDNVGLGGERVTRGKLAVEHVMPRKWFQHWPVTDTELAARERDRLLHTFGNLTLLTGKLNSSVSNGPWVGKNSKRDGLESHDVLMLNRDLLSLATDDWNEDKIRDRTGDLTEAIIKIWPVPDGHRSGSAQLARIKKQVDIADLLNAGLLESGETLFPRSQNPQGMIAIILSDGSLDIGGEIFATPSAAAMSITGNPTNGWWYFLSQDGVKSSSLRTLRSTYAEGLSEDIEDEIEDDDTDEDEEN